MSRQANIGWLYSKDYYRGFDYRKKDHLIQQRRMNEQAAKKEAEKYQEGFFEEKNQAIYGQFLEDHETKWVALFEENEENGFSLQTQYPGLISGTGLGHETKSKGESKLGFSFDPATGIPYLPASTVKGCLRAAFPQEVNSQKSKKLDPEGKAARREFITALLQEVTQTEDLDALRIKRFEKLGISAGQVFEKAKDLVDLLELEIFEGISPAAEIKNEKISYSLKPLSIYQRDVFHDAFPKESQGHGGKFLGPDFITPHKHNKKDKQHLNPFVNPVPILLLKILPKVDFRFQFALKDGFLTVAQKLELFKQILLHTGIGAKTNVGYGHLQAPPPPITFSQGQEVTGLVKEISGNYLTVYVEETDQEFEVKVRATKVAYENKDRYQEGNTYPFKVSAVTGKGKIKYIKG
jgi:CRISPR-associated protein Cmr6